MSEIGVQNPFAPPRAQVEDQIEHHAAMIEATRGSRLLAFLVDMSPMLAIAVLGIVAAVAMPSYAKSHPGFKLTDLSALLGLGLALGVAAIAWTIWNIVLLYRHGQTVGKKTMGIRVVRTDGSRVTFARFVFLRGLPLGILAVVVNAIAGPRHPLVSYIVTVVDCLLIFRASRQCLHDNIADTKVVTAASSEEATLAGSSGAHLRTINF
jgi:uncharacterized RDD family membrane protein YckC